ncbi:hypothetical protein vseg_018450 [Gypsophila vaccaria]
MGSIKSSSSLPQSIVFHEILPRVPAKSLVRFKTVCRSWYFTISSPDFAKTHLAFSRSRQVFLVEVPEIYYDLFGRTHTLHLLPYNDDVRDVEGLVELIPKYYANLVDCCNGIICLCLRNKRRRDSRVQQYILWNPATNEYREVDIPHRYYEARDHGFGYVSSIDDYKIVVIYYDSKVQASHVYFYSLKTGTWKRVVPNIIWTRDGGQRGKNSLFHDEKIYWTDVDFRSKKCYNWATSIDLTNEKWELYGGLNWLRYHRQYAREKLFVLQDRLALIAEVCLTGLYDVWMMDKAGDWNSWNKVFRVDIGHLRDIINVSNDGKYLVETTGPTRLELIHPPRDRSRQSIYPFERRHSLVTHIGFYFDTLISPFGNISHDEENISRKL